MKVKFIYADGTSEIIDGISGGVLSLGGGNACYYLGSCFIRYHVSGLLGMEVIEE